MRRSANLPAIVVAFRALHAAIAASFLLAIVYVWWCALTGRRGLGLRVAAAALVGEGVAITANGGDCPLGFVQDRVGDPVPLFELFLSPRAARNAVPVLGALAGLGIALLVHRDQAARPRRAAGNHWGVLRACRDANGSSPQQACIRHQPTRSD